MQPHLPTILLIALCFVPACYQFDATEADRDLMVQASDFVVLGAVLPEDLATYETFTRTIFTDASLELNYGLEFPDDYEGPGDIAYMSSSMAFDHRASGARINQVIEDRLADALFNDEDIALSKRDDLFRFGDSSRMYAIVDRASGAPVGHSLRVTAGNTVFAMHLVGFVIDDPAHWEILLGEKLKRMARTKPGFFTLDHAD